MSAWKDDAQRLRAQGLSIRQIAAATGMSRSVVGELFKPRQRLVCACGQPMGPHGNPKRCRGCFDAVADVRRTLAEGMWADGWSLQEMADTFGVGASYFQARRPDGWDLPHRYDETRVQAARAARWAA